MAQDCCSTVVYGCGNVIMGDDGFGPAVVERLLASGNVPEDVAIVDAGTGVREYLFDYLLSSENRPDRIIIIDAVDYQEKMPGEVFVLSPTSIPVQKIHDFSLHQFPTVNLLGELQEYTDIEITVIAAQIQYIPAEIEPGLSRQMQAAVALACQKVELILTENSQ